MGSGFQDFTAGAVLTADQVDGYLMRQSVMTFATAAARDSALSGVLDEGMVVYLKDSNTTMFYTGAAWEYLSEPPRSWNVTAVTQSASVACTTNYGWSRRGNGLFHAELKVTFDAAGTTGNDIIVAVPHTLVDTNGVGGTFVYLDQGTGYYAGYVIPFSTTQVKLVAGGNNAHVGTAPNFAIASTDNLYMTITGRYA